MNGSAEEVTRFVTEMEELPRGIAKDVIDLPAGSLKEKYDRLFKQASSLV